VRTVAGIVAFLAGVLAFTIFSEHHWVALLVLVLAIFLPRQCRLIDSAEAREREIGETPRDL
jgi:uncharacterized membrane protein YgaE (UPF0421/DUF939 family)